MANKKTKQKRSKTSKRNPSSSGESQRAESITVFWTTAVLGTVLCEVGGLAARAVMYFTGTNRTLDVLSGLLLLISSVTGLVSLGLLPLVYRWRHVPPPWPIVRFAIVAALLPFVILAAIMAVGT